MKKSKVKWHRNTSHPLRYQTNTALQASKKKMKWSHTKKKKKHYSNKSIKIPQSAAHDNKFEENMSSNTFRLMSW